MPIDDLRDGVFYPQLTLIMDSFIMCVYLMVGVCVFGVIWYGLRLFKFLLNYTCLTAKSSLVTRLLRLMTVYCTYENTLDILAPNDS